MRFGIVVLSSETPYQLNELVDLIVRKVSLEHGHVAPAFSYDLTEFTVFILLDALGTQIGYIEAGSNFRAFAMLGVARGAAGLKGLVCFFQ